MADKKKTIPTSVLIADTRNKLNELVQHPLLSATILELLFKEAWQSVALKAQAQLTAEYKTYCEEQEEEEDLENGI